MMDVEMDITVAKIRYAFPILSGKVQTDCTDSEFDEILEEIRAKGLTNSLKKLIVDEIKRYIRCEIVPKFWSYFKVVPEEEHSFELFKCAVDALHSSSIKFLPLLKRVEQLVDPQDQSYYSYGQKDHLTQFKLIVRATLLSQLPLEHEIIIEQFYKIAFNVFCNTDNGEGKNMSTSECSGCKKKMENCQCQLIVFMFHETNSKLLELDLLERLVGNVLTSLIHIRITEHVINICDRSFDKSQLKPLKFWLETVVLNWLIRIYSGGSSKTETLTEKIRDAIFKFKSKLRHFLYETYTRIRINQLFNIIIEYPDSQPAIDDLKICLDRTDLKKNLILNLQEALKTRLLHPGVNTPDILTAYIAAIKALRQLDPTGVLLETVTEPINSYLRSRSDTVRCVVSGLLDDYPSDLADELVKGETLQIDDGVEEDSKDWENWMPDPVDADPNKSTQRRTSDIISMLVNVYGSQDLFVNEYRTLLADRLLSQLNYHTEREIRHLELLKRRFGENQLHFCEVMLKDIYDSKRIDGLIQSNSNYTATKIPFATSALILSAQFWPPFKEEWKLELPGFVQEHLDKYVKAFETLKGNRTLSWKPHLGNVQLEVQLKDRMIDISVAPIHATIIIHFQEKVEWTLEELAEKMHIPATILRRKITFWVSQGLLKETSNDVFLLQEESFHKNRSLAEVIDEEEEAESVMASASDQREEELQVFWSYIVGMLTNLDSMPLERIHQMLKMFATQGPGAAECGLPELRQFLDKKVREHQLLFSGGLYRLPKI